MQLRAYQEEFISAVESDFQEHQKLLGVAATGSGKTIVSSKLMSNQRGRSLFLADAKELVRQNADKFHQFTGRTAAVEMADSKVELMSGDLFGGSPDIVVGTTQSMARRLDKYPSDYFDLIIVDEAHRNTVGDQAQSVLKHFGSAKVLGVTATPFRSDRKKLGDFYEKISINIGLPRLIREGYLSRITIKSVPVPMDLSQVGTARGDYKESDLGDALAPVLPGAADILKEHATGRRTVVFLPLIETSKNFVELLLERGVRAVHVDGKDRSELETFHNGDADVICNASLLTTGWDCPSVDCVYILRPTKSLALYQQMVGRGTRICEGKEDLLLLDPLYLSEDHRLVTPARLVATTKEEADAIDEKVRQQDEFGFDLLEAEEEAEVERKSALEERLKEKSKKRSRTVDAMEFALSLDHLDLAEYEPEFGWELQPPSDKQIAALEKAGFDTEEIDNKGKASKVLDLLFSRREAGLATPKQLKWLRKFKAPSAALMTFEEASAFLDSKFQRQKQTA